VKAEREFRFLQCEAESGFRSMAALVKIVPPTLEAAMTGTISRSDALANRERLIEAAHAVFAERGLDAEMKEIAERAGLGVGTIYRNFATKEDLLIAIVDRLCDRVLPEVRAILSGPDRARALRQFVERGLAVAEQDGELLTSMAERGWGAARRASPPAALNELLVAFIEDGARAGAFRDDLPPQALALFVMTQVAVYLQLRRHITPSDAGRIVADAAVRTLARTD
jgi:AcrR family transcriptional regulator